MATLTTMSLAVAGPISSTDASAGPDASLAGVAAPAAAYVDSDVYLELADRPATEFMVYLRETADLSGAATLASKPARTAYVYERLTMAARTTQRDLRDSLDARGVAYTSFWIANALLVEGDRALVDELAGRSDVASIEPDRTYPLIEPVDGLARVDGLAPADSPAPVGGLAPAGDPSIEAIEWGVANTRADQVWSQFGVTGEGIVVANIDTGVQFDHPALVAQYRGTASGGHDYNWFDPDGLCEPAVPCDIAGHGTHTMGTMVGDDGGDNQIGVAPGAQWIAAKGCESNACTGSALLAAGQWMVAPTDSTGQNPDPAMAPDIVNNSWGGGNGDTWYEAVVQSWVSAGIFPMFAAGNAGPTCGSVNSPGDNLPSYAVAAHDFNNRVAIFSGRGPALGAGGLKPNISAPGVSVRSAFPTDSYAAGSGTSMATPHAAGVVALLWSAVPELRGDIDGTRAVLDMTAIDTPTTECGSTTVNNFVYGEGRLDALAAVTQATGTTP